MVSTPVTQRLAVKLSTWRRLTWADRWLMVSAVVMIACFRILIATLGFAAVYAAMTRRAAKLAPTFIDASKRDRVVEIARIVDAAARHTLLTNTCLHRALTLWWMLRRRGFFASLQLGVRKQSDHFEAHAWVTYAGSVVNDADVVDGAYVPLSLTPLKQRA